MNSLRQFRERQWLWPVEDYHCWKHLTELHPDIPRDIIAEIGGASLIVQAGGNCGLYVAQYAYFCDEIHTFEPDGNNYKCLSQNVHEKNVIMYNKALGEATRQVALRTDRVNNGPSRAITGSGVDMIMLDSLQLKPDLIHLDIEGHEKWALKGARETIDKYSPAVVLECTDDINIGSGESILFELDYTKRKQFGLDWLYTR